MTSQNNLVLAYDFATTRLQATEALNLIGIPAVQQAQVIGVPDARLGEVAAAYVVLRAGKQASVEELLVWCRQRCANFKVPRYLRLVDGFEQIGMTGSSKVQKNLLRQHALVDLGLDDNKRAPA